MLIPDGATADLLRWQADAACRSVDDPEVMYPDPTNRRGIAEALGQCEVCPVLPECREWALSAQEPYGVWGGLTEGDRRDLIGKKPAPRTSGGGRLRSPCGTRAASERHRRYGEECDQCATAAAAGFPDDPKGER